MNKYQEALDYLVSNGTHETLYSWGDEIEVETERGGESVNLLQELVDKATPTKLLKSQIDGYRECGNCESIVVSTNHVLPKYCGNCGQRIDWGNEE